MNCGLSNLDTLKRYVLAPSLATSAQFDDALRVVGLGVAGLLDKFCNRRFGFETGATWTGTADRAHLVLPRYPIVAVSAVALKLEGEADFSAQADEPVMINLESGLVRFSGELGGSTDLLKVTWTGGYWFETKEPNDAGYPTTLPAGATALPGDLQLAFLTQCEQVWQTHDRLGTGIVGGDGGQFLNTRLSTLELVPAVKEMLRGFVRYQLS